MALTCSASSFARMASMLERDRAIAEDVPFPTALDVDADADGVIPGSHFDLLAEEGPEVKSNLLHLFGRLPGQIQ